MHKYMRAIGFSSLTHRDKLKEILTDTIMNPENWSYTTNTEQVMLGEFSKSFADGLGIAVCGEFDEGEKFIYDYYYPFLKGSGVTSAEDVSVERHASRNSYAGVCDDINVGISLIFYLRNMIPYVKAQTEGRLPIRGTTVTLSALSVEGTILMPIKKDEKQRDRVKQRTIARNQLIEAARKGNEEAIETLTLEDMDIFSDVSARIQHEDLLSIIDTSFMPYGVECDQYAIIGEIVGMRKTVNRITNEEIYVLSIYCNELTFDVAINIIDLFGEPRIGRRFKGTVWLQGFINFPE